MAGENCATTATGGRQADYDWDLSIWQMEVSLTQIFGRPLRGREFFDEIIADNLDLGRPGRVQLIFGRRASNEWCNLPSPQTAKRRPV